MKDDIIADIWNKATEDKRQAWARKAKIHDVNSSVFLGSFFYQINPLERARVHSIIAKERRLKLRSKNTLFNQSALPKKGAQ